MQAGLVPGQPNKALSKQRLLPKRQQTLPRQSTSLIETNSLSYASFDLCQGNPPTTQVSLI